MDRKRFLKQLTFSIPAVTIAVNSGSIFCNSLPPQKDMVNVGFAKCSLVSAIKSSVEFRRELESVCIVIKNNLTKIAIVALDLIEITPKTNQALQKKISELTNFPEECILLHTTHTHSSPWDSREKNSIEGIGYEIAKAILKADQKAISARLKIGNADVGKSLSFQRIAYTDEELGFQSFWYGFQYKKGDNRPDASALVNEMKSRWLGNEPDYKAGEKPIWFNRKVDPLIQTMVFEDLEGKTIGSIVRFSAHAGPADACRNRKYDPDYPAVVRDYMEEKLGGIGMYISGSLGNLAPKVKIDYEINKDIKLPESYLGPTWAVVAKEEKQALAERDRIGKEIAIAALESIKGQKSEKINDFQFNTKMCKLPLDPNLPKSIEDIEQTKKILITEYESFKRIGENISEIRLLANRLNWLNWTRQFVDLIGDEDRKKGYTNLPLSALKINKTCLAFMHSEPMAETSLELRKIFPELNLVAICLTGGSVQYIPTSEIIDMGGYEGRATIIRRDGEEKMRKDISSIIIDMINT